MAHLARKLSASTQRNVGVKNKQQKNLLPLDVPLKIQKK
jgi:hypothetical protein